jgi:hypothetical protein
MCATGPDFASAAKSERDMIGRSQRQIQLRVAAFLTTYGGDTWPIREFARTRKGFLRGW